MTLFGALLCLDGFLYNFTILPIRSLFATSRILANILHRRAIWPIPPTHLLSILRMLLLFIPTVILLFATDASKMYHTVRGQDTIKLYVIFNALEVSPKTKARDTREGNADRGRLPIVCAALSGRTSSIRYSHGRHSYPRPRRRSLVVVENVSKLDHSSFSLCRWAMSVSTHVPYTSSVR